MHKKIGVTFHIDFRSRKGMSGSTQIENSNIEKYCEILSKLLQPDLEIVNIHSNRYIRIKDNNKLSESLVAILYLNSVYHEILFTRKEWIGKITDALAVLANQTGLQIDIFK